MAIAISSLKVAGSTLSSATAVTTGSGDKTLYLQADANTGRINHKSIITVAGNGGTTDKRTVVVTQDGNGLTLKGSSAYSVASDADSRAVTIKATTNAYTIQILPLLYSGGAVTTSPAGTSTATGYYTLVSDSTTSYVTSINAENSKAINMSTSLTVNSLTYSTVYAGGTSVSGSTITSDPGATAAYEFQYVVNVPANTADHDCYYLFRITANGGTDEKSETGLPTETLDVQIKAAKANGFLYVGADTNTTNTATYNVTLPAAASSTVSFGINSNTSWTIS